ncbi:hypothetical protein SDJN03_02210, partial [Cucurbita argyrosperma subsp. sororia]
MLHICGHIPKGLLIGKAISCVIPINLAESEKTIKIPIVGNVDIPSSDVKPGDSGVLIPIGLSQSSKSSQNSVSSLFIRISEHQIFYNQRSRRSTGLDDFEMPWKWSNIGNLHRHLIQNILQVVLFQANLSSIDVANLQPVAHAVCKRILERRVATGHCPWLHVSKCRCNHLLARELRCSSDIHKKVE